MGHCWMQNRVRSGFSANQHTSLLTRSDSLWVRPCPVSRRLVTLCLPRPAGLLLAGYPVTLLAVNAPKYSDADARARRPWLSRPWCQFVASREPTLDGGSSSLSDLTNSAADSSAAAQIYPRSRQMELPFSSNANRFRHTPDASRDELSSQTDC
jgi:hypothetical protein